LGDDDAGLGEQTHGRHKPSTSDRYLTQTHELLDHFTRSGEVRLDRLAIGLP
jgi:site-specific DNA-methyltransferase (adenine-specific)